jgi:hypothetical protein
MILWAALAAMVLLAVLGGVVRRAAGGQRALDGGFALDFAIGAVALAFVGTCQVVAGAELSRLPFIALFAVAWIVTKVRRVPEDAKPVPVRGRRGVVLALALAPLAVLAAWALWMRQDRLWWDGWAIWALKARVLYDTGGLPSFFLAPRGAFAFTHLDYPLGVPLVDWWAFSVAGGAEPPVASIAGIVWTAMVAAAAWNGLRRRAGDVVAAGAALGIVLFRPLVFFAAGGTADVAIALALLGAAVETERAFRGEGSFWRVGVYLSLGIFAKNEGLALAVAATAVCLATLAIQRRKERGAVALAMPFVLFAPWYVFTRIHGLVPDNIAEQPSVAHAAGRLGLLVQGMMGLFSGPSWLPVAAMVAVALAHLYRRRDAPVAAAWGVLLAYLAAVMAVYLQAPQDLGWLMSTSLVRVMGAMVPAAVYLSISTISPAPSVLPPPAPGAMRRPDDDLRPALAAAGAPAP